MMAVFTASYLSFQPPDMSVLYWVGVGGVLLLLILLVARWLERMRLRRAEARSAWRTFRRIARAHGLNQRQIRILASVAKAGKLRRPAQIMGSVLVLDRCTTRARERGLLDDGQLNELGEIRARILASPENHGKEDRRHLQRARCELTLEVVLVPRGEFRSDASGSQTPDGPQLEEIAAGYGTTRATLQELSAGGASLLIPAESGIEEGWFVGIRDVGEQASVDLGGIWGEVVAVGGGPFEDIVVLHVRFLPYDIALKREIIKVVYAASDGQEQGGGASESPKSRNQGPSLNSPSHGRGPTRSEQESEQR